jgi:hypothetical protein
VGGGCGGAGEEVAAGVRVRHRLRFRLRFRFRVRDSDSETPTPTPGPRLRLRLRIRLRDSESDSETPESESGSESAMLHASHVPGRSIASRTLQAVPECFRTSQNGRRPATRTPRGPKAHRSFSLSLSHRLARHPARPASDSDRTGVTAGCRLGFATARPAAGPDPPFRRTRIGRADSDTPVTVPSRAVTGATVRNWSNA